MIRSAAPFAAASTEETSFMSRTSRRAVTVATITAIAGSVLLGGTAASAATQGTTTAPSTATAAGAAGSDSVDDRSSFVVPVLPDTQFYSRYSASQFVPQYGTNPFEVQTQWIVDNQRELNMPFTVHVGDVVDQQGQSGEWDAAAKAMKILTDGGMEYSVLPGNHDVSDMNARSSVGISGNYLARFGESQLRAQAGDGLIGTFQNGLSSAYLFQAEGHTWMSLAIAWNASDDTFAWAQGVLDAHPGVPVILSSHAIIGIAEDQVSPASWWWGEELWNRLIKSNDEIILTVNGHFHGSTSQTRTNDAGHPVYQVLTDYQMAADGGNGIMSLFEFNLSGGDITLSTISPWVPKKHANSVTSTDAPVLTGSGQSLTMPLDFRSRFGWTIDPSQEDDVDLSARAKAIVSKGWNGSNGGTARAVAGASDDYIQVDGTVAHWRFGGVPEGVVDENSVIPDVAGDSPMYRNAIDQTDANEALDDVKVSHENHAYYSSDFGAVCFSNVYRNASGPDNLSFLSTEYGAPATFADLTASTGYTLESFLQLGEGWTETANRWGAAITRGGSREWTGIHDSADPGAGAAWLGISSLREYQYSAGDTTTGNSYTNWSGEIMPGSWHHVAIVNDPDARTVIMYVDGVPVLRNASNVGGMMAADFMPWIIGTSTWDTEPDHGWNGCVGETRIVDHALSQSEFLTERVDIDGTGANFALTTDTGTVLAHDAKITEFTGTGFPGAKITVTAGQARLGETVVAQDGTWKATLDAPVAGSGAHAFAFTQAIGTRSGKPFEATLTIGENTAWSPVDSDLTDSLEGLITVTPENFVAGQAISVRVPEGHEGEELSAFLFSQPTGLGLSTVTGGSMRLVTPASLPLGVHRLAVYTADGTILGWSNVLISAPVTGTDPVPVTDPTAPVAAGPGASGALPTTGIEAASLMLLVGAGVGALAFGVGAVRRARRR